LGLWFDARGTGLRLALPAGHAKFLQREPNASAGDDDLVMSVRDAPPIETGGKQVLLCQTEVWELWRDEAGHYIFSAPRQRPPRRVVVDTDFTAGEVTGEFSSSGGKGLYPLQSLDIRLYANWLANTGDIVLHAAGVSLDGQGVCFAGPPGAGKSTLVASLLSTSRKAVGAAQTLGGTTIVLGEDNLVLRYLEGGFWIYGTPWHIDPAFCAPLGVPLTKLYLLDRTAPPGVGPCAPAIGIARLLQTAFIPYYRPAAVSAILDRLALLAERVPFYTLNYRLGKDVLGVIGDA
jgi:hypothetical protein